MEDKMEYPEELYTEDVPLPMRGMASAVAERSYRLGYEAGKAEQADYIESMSSLDSVLIDVEQLEGEDLPFVKRLIERAFRAGKADVADPLAGYSNLTAAISAGEPIDWERLDGLNVKCVNPELRGELHGTLKRDDEITAEHCGAWWNGRMDECYTTALWSGWNDKHGWTLWVKGEIPLRRKTADQLKVGTYFLGKNPERKDESLVCVGGWNIRDCKSIYYAPSLIKSNFPASEWVVIEEYGPFQKPEGK